MEENKEFSQRAAKLTADVDQLVEAITRWACGNPEGLDHLFDQILAHKSEGIDLQRTYVLAKIGLAFIAMRACGKEL